METMNRHLVTVTRDPSFGNDAVLCGPDRISRVPITRIEGTGTMVPTENSITDGSDSVAEHNTQMPVKTDSPGS